jgi:hypothetical protein
MCKVMQAQAEIIAHEATPPRRRWSGSLSLAAAGVTLLLAATVALWAYYGTAVFYETILAGIAACI